MHTIESTAVTDCQHLLARSLVQYPAPAFGALLDEILDGRATGSLAAYEPGRDWWANASDTSVVTGPGGVLWGGWWRSGAFGVHVAPREQSPLANGLIRDDVARDVPGPRWSGSPATGHRTRASCSSKPKTLRTPQR